MAASEPPVSPDGSVVAEVDGTDVETDTTTRGRVNWYAPAITAIDNAETSTDTMATRPGRIIATIPVELPRPRLRTSVLTSDFIAIKERCLQHLEWRADAPLDDAA